MFIFAVTIVISFALDEAKLNFAAILKYHLVFKTGK